MGRARDIANIINSGTFITPASASTTFLTQTSASTIYQGAPNRNLIINGAMQVAQRATSLSSITTSLYKTADRWALSFPSALGTWTQSVENDGPTGSEFGKSLKMLCTTAQATPSSGAGCILYQVIEGQNLQGVKKGTSEAQPLTLSFWVKSNVTGTYVSSLVDENNSIGFPPYGTNISRTYTVNAINTWEKKTLTFSAGTDGVIPNNNSYGLRLWFYLAAGSSFQSGTLNSSWGSSAPETQAVGQVNVASAVNNYWQVTGIQLEIGSTATPFDLKPFDEELRKCQRYYETGTFGNNVLTASYVANAYQGGPGFPTNHISFKVTKRVTPHTIPTLTISGMWTAPGSFGVTANTNHTFVPVDASPDNFKFITNRVSGNSTPNTASMYHWESSPWSWNVSAEL
jgi:hypothetical protein